MTQTPPPFACENCGWQSPAPVDHCPNCQGLVRNIQETNIPQPTAPPRTFSLGSLFLAITLICVGLGLTLAFPGLGILFLLLVVPALIRTSAIAKKRHLPSHPATAIDHLQSFLTSFGIMFLVELAGFIAWTVACGTGFAVGSVGGSGNDVGGLFIGAILGAPFALWLIGWLIWKTWPTRN